MQNGLNKCGKDGCNPVEQMRGQLKPEDHHLQHRRLVGAKEFMEDFGVWLPIEDFRRDAYDTENQGPDNNSDTRISCSRCGKATGWDRRDIEEFRRHGDADNRRHVLVRDGNLEKIRDRWNEMVK